LLLLRLLWPMLLLLLLTITSLLLLSVLLLSLLRLPLLPLRRHMARVLLLLLLIPLLAAFSFGLKDAGPPLLKRVKSSNMQPQVVEPISWMQGLGFALLLPVT
jgi:hypothetical protein